MVFFVRVAGLNVMAFLFVLNELAAANPPPKECPTKSVRHYSSLLYIYL